MVALGQVGCKMVLVSVWFYHLPALFLFSEGRLGPDPYPLNRRIADSHFLSSPGLSPPFSAVAIQEQGQAVRYSQLHTHIHTDVDRITRPKEEKLGKARIAA